MKRSGIILFGLGLVIGPPISAQTQTSPTPAPIGTNKSLFEFMFRFGSGIYGEWPDAPQVGPYIGSVGHSITGPQFTLYSVDYLNTIYSGYRATALVSNLGEEDLSGTRLEEAGEADVLLRYQQSAYLASLYFANMGSWSAIQAAIWAVMTPGFAYSAYANDGTDWLATAQNADLSGFNFNSWTILTPYAQDRFGDWVITSRQEMLAQNVFPEVTALTPATVTPEPETYVLLLSGMVFLAFVGRRRLREAGYA